ncbi:chymotrypsin-elastase inhibitor ixodidin-like [Dermacentor variabilis]|uniref:chymotrypsin-elastase inhibitor ixodidin-like n=1 Tax=Dermacentor variabilis TaxID=34621 RepID=UPI003F5AF69E
MKPQALVVVVSVLLAGAVLCHAQGILHDYPRPSGCGPGEVLKQCQSSTCAEFKCADPRPPIKCTYDCVTGCFCADGFYRTSSNGCVPKHLCS